MYNARETECAELKESLARQEQPNPVTTHTPPPTPPISSKVSTAPRLLKWNRPVTAPTSTKAWASSAQNSKLAAQDNKTGRSQYMTYMNALPQPVKLRRPKFTDQNSVLQPVAKLDGYDVFSTDLETRWQMLHCPKRTVWCSQSRIHAIVFAPTYIFLRRLSRCAENRAMIKYCGSGQSVEFFASKGELVYYVGTYVVHSLRAVHPPGGDIPSDVSDHAIYLQMGMTEAEVKNSSHLLPGGRVGTECFGMQCVGFDHDLYLKLRERFTASGTSKHPDKGAKRKAPPEEGELRDDSEYGVKMPRVA